MSPSPHSVIFFERDEGLLAPLKEFAVQGLDAGERVIVIATAAHTAALVAALGSRRVGAPSADNFILFSADDAIDRVAPGGTVERERLFNWLGPFTEAGPCRIFGEMVSLLAARDQFEAAFDLEAVGDELAHDNGIQVLCAYDLRHLAGAGNAHHRAIACHDIATVPPLSPRRASSSV
jgi:hypothetical protein